MNTKFILLSKYEKPVLNFKEVCDAIGISVQSGYNMRSQGIFPIPMIDKPLRASIDDIANYIDEQFRIAREKIA